MKKPQLFLMHFAGGNIYSFQFMTQFLSHFSVFPLELPGRGDRIDESPINDLNLAAQDIYSQILVKLDGSNFILFGHSMGATLALKVAGMLEQVKKFPSYLFVSGHEGPRIDYNKKRHLFDDEGLVEELRKFGGVPAEILENKDFLDFYLPIFRVDLEVVEKEPYFESIVSIPIYAMMGDTDEYVDKISNWKNFTNSTFNFKIFEGGHFFIHKYPREIVNIITKNYNMIISQ